MTNEREKYEELLNLRGKTIGALEALNNAKDQYWKLFFELQKSCNHPYIVEYKDSDDALARAQRVCVVCTLHGRSNNYSYWSCDQLNGPAVRESKLRFQEYLEFAPLDYRLAPTE